MYARKAVSQDLEDVSTLFDQYRSFYGRSSDPALAKRFIQERINNEDSLILVAESLQGKIAAFTQLYPSFSSISAAPVYVLNDLYVAPAHRRQGAGRALLEAAREFARQKGAVALSLSTAIDNKNAQSLYESLGWEMDRKFLHYNLTVEANQALQPTAESGG
jgi:ribosomal protein S18 acetylase RimI-like enzyme